VARFHVRQLELAAIGAYLLGFSLLTSRLSFIFKDEIMKENPSNAGVLFFPVILGSNKTTVSVVTSQNEYYSLYLSIGNIHNNVQCVHHEAMIPIGFLAIPKGKFMFRKQIVPFLITSPGERKHDKDPEFLCF